MEKQTAEERRRKWQWQTADGAHALVKSCLGATLWPCGVYSRTSSRLSSSLAGLGTIYDQGYCNPDGMLPRRTWPPALTSKDDAALATKQRRWQPSSGVGDQAAALATKHTGREHRLEANQAVGTPRREEPQALKDEPTVAAARSDGGAAHGLDHDVKVDSASLDARHGLRSDKELKTKLPVKKPQASGGG